MAREQTSQQIMMAAGGNYGSKLIADTTTVTKNFAWVYFVEDTVFASGTTVASGDTPSFAKTYKAGSVLVKPFTAIKLTSGSVEAGYSQAID